MSLRKGQSRSQFLLKLGKAIRKERRNQGLSQEFLAERVGISRVFLSQIERGKKNTSLLVIDAIARALHVKTSTLLHDL